LQAEPDALDGPPGHLRGAGLGHLQAHDTVTD